MADPRLRTSLPRGVILRDPLLLASGCCGFGQEYAALTSQTALGGIITKAVSLDPRPGNPPPRLHETPAGLLNCIGLQNPGVVYFLEHYLPELESAGGAYLVNVVGRSAAEFAAVIQRIEGARLPVAPPRAKDGASRGLCGYELDLSCPNVESGTQFATDLDLLRATVQGCRAVTERLLAAKLSPNVTDIVPFAQAAREAGADAVTIANTWLGVSIDIRTRQSHLARPAAGLSGPAIRPATLHHVWRCHRALPELPVIGCGGISDTDAAVQYLLAGATALELGTGLFLNPRLPQDLQQGLSSYLEEQDEKEISAIIGTYRD